MTYTRYITMSARMIVVVSAAFLFHLTAAMDVPDQSGFNGSFFEDALLYIDGAVDSVMEAAFQAAVARASTSARTAAIVANLLHPQHMLDGLGAAAAEFYVQQQDLEVQYQQMPNNVEEPPRPFQYPPPTPPEPQAYYIPPANRFPAPVATVAGWVSDTFTPLVHTIKPPAPLRPLRTLRPKPQPSATGTTPGTQSSTALFTPTPQISSTPDTSIITQKYPCSHSGCDKSCSTRAALRKHQKSHIPVADRKHGCPAETCSRRFNDKKDLVKHQRTHDANHTVQFACPHLDCQAHTKLIVRWDNYLRHMEDIHQIVLPRKTKKKDPHQQLGRLMADIDSDGFISGDWKRGEECLHVMEGDLK
nr:hypothetical protein B0A51_10269 [Rachicladosporium sp. CCFEE 5018]